MASKKVKKSPPQQSSKKTAPKKKFPGRKAGKSKKKNKKQIRKASQDPVRPIPPVPPLPEEDLEEMEKARSQFNGPVGDTSAKQQKLEKQEKSRKAALTESAENIFEKHKNFCDRISGLVNDINSLVSQAAAIDGVMKHSDLRSYNINRRLNFDSLVKDLRVASTRLGRMSANSGTLNKIHRDLVSEDINSKKPAFE